MQKKSLVKIQLGEALVSHQGSEWTSLPVTIPACFSTKWNSCLWLLYMLSPVGSVGVRLLCIRCNVPHSLYLSWLSLGMDCSIVGVNEMPQVRCTGLAEPQTCVNVGYCSSQPLYPETFSVQLSPSSASAYLEDLSS